MRKKWLASLAVAIMFFCGAATFLHAETYGEIGKIKVTRSGEIYLNNKTLPEAELARELVRIKGAGGAVWYFRENPDQKPTEEQLRAFRIIVDAKIPIRLVSNEQDLK